MIRTTSTASLLLLSILAVPAPAETAPASSPAPTPTTPAPVAVAEPAPVPVAVTEPESAVDAFGLPCEVSFTPRTATAKPSKPAKPGKAAKAARAAKKGRAARAAKPQPGFSLAAGGVGSDFALGRADRGPAAPKGDAEVRMHAATVTPAMVGLVVREHAAELELCLSKLPRDARAATVGLVLTIEADGTASSARVTGAPQAPAFATCLATQARTWAYPHADAAVEIEYPITVNGR